MQYRKIDTEYHIEGHDQQRKGKRLTNIKDIIERVESMRGKCAGHLARMKNSKWAKQATVENQTRKEIQRQTQAEVER